MNETYVYLVVYLTCSLTMDHSQHRPCVIAISFILIMGFFPAKTSASVQLAMATASSPPLTAEAVASEGTVRDEDTVHLLVAAATPAGDLSANMAETLDALGRLWRIGMA